MQDDIKNTMDSFKEYCSKFSTLVIYGAGDVGKMVAEFMEEEGISFECFCVTEKPVKSIFCNHSVKGLDEVMHCSAETGFIVAVSQKNAEEILGLLENRKILYFYCKEFLFQLFERRCRKSVSEVLTQDGYIDRISDVALARDELYICCPASIGDTLYIAALVKAYKIENPSVQKICLVLKKGHMELGALFPAVDDVLVSDEIVKVLEYYSLHTQVWTLKNYIYGHFKKSNRFIYDSEYNREDCRDILSRYCRLIMKLQAVAEPEEMHLCGNIAHAEERNNDVVIMPYARTARLLSSSFWEILVRRLNEGGYSVYTNIGSEKEKPVQGTLPMEETLLDTALLCERCKAVISLRSGLCDLLGFTKTKLIVVNTSEELSEEWNLENVFDRDGIYNISCYEKRNYNNVIDRIMNIIG